ncbi:MAG: hypothetical protein J6A08_13790 [Lachnospiraceae bacterium]|nr:hypothetical protein [Lachnospiraceae bacterium]
MSYYQSDETQAIENTITTGRLKPLEGMKGMIRKINWKILIFSFYFEIVISYFLPFKITDEYKYQVGFPFPFLTIYNKPIIHANPFLSMHLNEFSLAINLVIIYFATILLLNLYKKGTAEPVDLR